MNITKDFHVSQVALVLSVRRYSFYGSLASSSIAFMLALAMPFQSSDFARASILLSQIAAAATCWKLESLKSLLVEDKYDAIVKRSNHAYSEHLAASYLPSKREVAIAHLEVTEKPSYYDWGNISDEAVGFLICGNSGYGKSSLATWLAGYLSKDEPMVIIALDPHWNDCWKLAGIVSIGNIEKIEAICKWLLTELNERCDRKGKGEPIGDPIFIICDELNSALERFADKKIVESTLKRLGSEGRKFGLIFCGLNQSSNAGALGIDAKYKSNYAVILCGQSARTHPQLGKHLVDVAYPCLLDGSIAPTLAIHPTHHDYKVFKKKGNPPKNLMQINQLPFPDGLLSIIADYPEPKTATLSVKSEAIADIPKSQITAPALKAIVNYLDGRDWVRDNLISQSITEFKAAKTPIAEVQRYLQYLGEQGYVETRNAGRNGLEARKV
jgi:energy-coupling factor transporter ATP-binding protein EcfA2